MTSVPNRRDFLHQMAGVTALAVSPEFLPRAPVGRPAELRVGLVGVGRWGSKLLAELLKFEQVEVGAICDTNSSGVRRGKRRVPEANSYSDHREMLEKEKDLAAVFVATPTHLHKAVALDSPASRQARLL